MCGPSPARTVKGMDETYRMLGKGHQADLEREARTRRLAADARPARPARGDGRRRTRHSRIAFVPARLAALLPANR
jgi:hypothetical protein